MLKKYKCIICDSRPDQLSHHKSHLKTQKHKDKRKIFELELKSMSNEELNEKYGICNIEDIIKKKETQRIKIVTKKPKMIISNKEALKDKIHDIHNYLRNHGAGYGMNALKVFNIIYGLKKIEENGLIEISGLCKNTCTFSDILDMAIKNKDEELTELIQCSILDSISSSNIRNILFYEIPKNISGSVFSYLIKEINEISEIEKSTNTQLCGKIYEYFIGRDQTAISELGAYFTDRHITDFLYKEEEIILDCNGNVPKMCDPFGGSGGFTVGYLLYLKEKYPNINWNDQINNVHHYDMNEDVIKSAALEFFSITGQIPDMKSSLRYANSFTDEFCNNKYKKIFTNPPYGGDDSKKTQKQSKRDKVKKYIYTELKTLNEEKIKERKKQLKDIEEEEKYEKKIKEQSKVTLSKSSARIQAFAKKFGLKGNDKESVSLIQLMDLVDIDGTVVGVLKEGVFFNKTYKGLRECLIKHFNVRKVISIPSDQFENTSTKTSALVFDNTEEKTSSIEFSELIVEKYKEDKFEEIDGKIVCTNYSGEGSKLKPDIKNVEKKIVSIATAEEILENETISFNGKDYIKNVIVPGDGYELKKLGDICDLEKNVKAEKKNENGKYNYFSCSRDISLCNEANNTGEYIIMGTRGTILESLKYYNGKFGVGNSVILLKKKEINIKFIFFLLQNIKKIIFKITGSTIPMINNKSIINSIIPIPKSSEKIQYWVDKISTPFNENNKKQILLKNHLKDLIDKIKNICENEECIEEDIKSIYDVIYGDKTKKMINNDKLFKQIGGGSNIKNLKTDNKWNTLKNTIIVARSGSPGNVNIFNENTYVGSFAFTLNIKDNVETNNFYNYYFLKCYQQNIIDLAEGSVQKNLNRDKLNSFKIKTPINKKIITELDEKFKYIEELKIDIVKTENKFNKYLKELGDEAIKK